MKYYIFFDGIYNWPIKSGKHYLAQILSRYNQVTCFDRPNFVNLIHLTLQSINFREKISNRLHVIHSFSFIPKSQKYLTIDKISYYLNYKIFRSKVRNNSDMTVISYTPELYLIEKQFQNINIFYYVVDDYLSYPLWSNKNSKKNFLLLEKKFIKVCEGIIVSSITLFEKYNKLHPHVFYFPNPSPIKAFLKSYNQNNPIPSDIENLKKPIIGFIGGIENYRINLDLIKTTADSFPEYSFVLIGPVNIVNKEKIKLPECTNIYYLGVKPHEILINYLHCFDVAIIPYKLNDYGNACFPMKIFEYLAIGKPVVTTALPAIKYLSRHNLIYWSENNQKFIENIRVALNEINKKKIIEARIQEANKNDWHSRINQLINFIEN